MSYRRPAGAEGKAMHTLLDGDPEVIANGNRLTAAELPILIPSVLGREVRITGEVVSHQDLFVDGELEGRIELPDHKLTIGPRARVKAHIKAQNVVIVGNAEGTIESTERVELCSQSQVLGDIKTPRIIIKDGAHFRGTIDVLRPALAADASAHDEVHEETIISS